MDVDSPDLAYVNNERTWISVKSRAYETLICGVYMGYQAPNDGVHGEWNDGLYRVLSEEQGVHRALGRRIVMLGDFNGHIGAEPGVGVPGNHNRVNPNGRRLLNFLQLNDMVHLNGARRAVDGSQIAQGLWTRQRNGHSTVIDYTLVSAEHLASVDTFEIDDKGVYGGGSDHNWSFLEMSDDFDTETIRPPDKVEKEHWDISGDTDWTSFKEVVRAYLSKAAPNTVEGLGGVVSKALLEGLEKVVGVKTNVSGKRFTRLPEDIVKECKEKRNLERNWKTSLTSMTNKGGAVAEDEKDAVRKAEETLLAKQEEVKQLVHQHRGVRRKKVAKMCAGHSPKAWRQFWSIVTNRFKVKNMLVAVLNPVSKVLKCSPHDIVKEVEDHLTKLFCGTSEPPGTIGDEEHKGGHDEKGGEDELLPGSQGVLGGSGHSYAKRPSPVLPKYNKSRDINTNPAGWISREFSVKEVKALVHNLKNNKAAGVDSIPNEALKNAPEEFLVILTKLFNLMLKTAKLPSGWEVGLISLIHKSGPREVLSNYRPLTVINSLCGLYTKALNERLTRVVEHHGLLGEIQNGFRKERCGADNNFILHTVLAKAAAMGKKVFLSFVDVSKVCLTLTF